ncbi:hypothetical protein PV326_004225 [Microctonus aethiopoides]|nr:hypothetical protein PV326_004225 [Microctonus aethiopoides]
MTTATTTTTTTRLSVVCVSGEHDERLKNQSVTVYRNQNHQLDSMPIDDGSKKLTLDTPKEILNSASIRVPTRWEKGVELLGQLMDAIRFGTGRIVNFGMMARNEIATRAEEFTSGAANAILSLIAARDARKYIQKTTKNTIEQQQKQKQEQQQQKRSALEITTVPAVQTTSFEGIIPPITRETVRLESETGQSILEAPKPKILQDLLRNSPTPKPVVDRTKEEDKYGNEGGAGRGIVKGIDGISNLINNLVDFPGNAFKQFTKNINQALNRVGEKLIGLA